MQQHWANTNTLTYARAASTVRRCFHSAPPRKVQRFKGSCSNREPGVASALKMQQYVVNNIINSAETVVNCRLIELITKKKKKKSDQGRRQWYGR